jgi:hypothetical protein
MTHEQKGVYMDLLSILWIEDGLPSDTGRLARLVGIPRKKFDRLWPGIAPCFRAGASPESLEQPRLSKEKLKQLAYKHLQALKGAKGGKSKGINRRSKPVLPSGLLSAKAESKPNPSIAVRSSQFAVPVPTTNGTTDNDLVQPPAGPEPADGPGRLTLTAVEPEKVRNQDVQRLFDAWKAATGHAQARLTPERDRYIRSRLREGYAVEFCERAIAGCVRSPFHQGQNDRGTRYDDLTLIFRSGSKLEWFAEMEGAPKDRGDAEAERKKAAEEQRMVGIREQLAKERRGLRAVGEP